MCQNCEKSNHQDHPLIKFNSKEDMEKFKLRIRELYTGEGDSSEEEEEKVDLASSSFTPKIIDSRVEQPLAIPQERQGLNLLEYGCTFVSSMPRSNYTIDDSHPSIHLT